MKREYIVTGTVTVSAYTRVTAKNEQEARRIAEQRYPTLGGLNSGADPNSEFVIEDADGEVEIIGVEER